MSNATIYDYIAKNNRNTFFLVLLFPITLTLIMYALMCVGLLIADTDGTMVASGVQIADALNLVHIPLTEHTSHIVLIALAALGYTTLAALPLFAITGLWLIIAYFSGSSMLLSAAAANPVRKSESPEIYRLVENVAIAAGLPTPKLYIIRDESLNAFATGRDINHASIILTTGLIQALDRQELEGVIAHEMAHIGNRDIRLMLMIIIGIGALTFLADLLFRVMSSGSKGRGNNNGAGAVYLVILVVALSLVLFSILIAPLLRFAISRSQEYNADSTAALITRNPGALASALEKISADSRVEVLDKMPSMSAMCIADPLGKSRKRFFDSLSGLYATHPPIDKRILALKRMDSRA